MKPARARCLLLSLSLVLCLACAKTDAEWTRDLHGPDPFVRGLAAIGLGLQSPRRAGPALPTLLKTVDHSDVGLEREAARVLSHVGPYHVEALLEELVRDELMTRHRRGAILNALVSAGPAAPEPIVACLRRPGHGLAGDLGEVLLSIGEPAVPALVELLSGAVETPLRTFAAYLLGRLGPRAHAAEPALRAACSSPDAGLRDTARQALALVTGTLSREVR